MNVIHMYVYYLLYNKVHYDILIRYVDNIKCYAINEVFYLIFFRNETIMKQNNIGYHILMQ